MEEYLTRWCWVKGCYGGRLDSLLQRGLGTNEVSAYAGGGGGVLTMTRRRQGCGTSGSDTDKRGAIDSGRRMLWRS